MSTRLSTTIFVSAVFLALTGLAEAVTLTITTAGPNTGAVSVIGPGGNVCNPFAGGSCTFTYAAGTPLRVTANAPATPGVISGGTGSAAACGTSTCAFVLDVDSSITVTFNAGGGPFTSLQMVLGGSGKGQVSADNSSCQNYELGFSGCTSYYATGSQVTLNGGSVAGNVFAGFSGGTNDAAVCGANATCVFTLTTNSVVTASFAQLTSIAVQPGTTTADVGQTRTFTAVGTYANGVTRNLFGSGLWQSKSSMSLARFALAAGVVNDRLYAIGGADGVCPSMPCAFAPQSIVERFTPGNNGAGQFETWQTVAPMATPREGLAAAVANGRIYAIGGHTTGGAAVASMEAFDPATNTWAPAASMPTARAAFAAVAINDTIYAVGGGTLGAPLDTLEAYDVTSNTWTTKAPMPTPRSYLAAAAINGKLYAIGGSASGVVEEYDPATDSWTTKASLPIARDTLAATVLEGLLYVVGGQAGVPLGTVEAYNPLTNTWATLPSSAAMPTARGSLALATLDGRLFAVGGLTSATNVTAALQGFRAEVSWWSSDPAVAPITQNGSATPIAGGSTTISARSAGIDSGAQSGTLSVNQLLPPTSLNVVAVNGTTVTFAWLAPSGGITPTGYAIEGGLSPGDVLATVPTGPTQTSFTLTLPIGTFYLRVHSVSGSQRSIASNEIRVSTLPTAPSAPTGLLGSANGSDLVLSWTNTFAGGLATGVVLDVTGTVAGSLPLPLTNGFTFAGVPAGTYSFAVRATNSAGSSAQSNVVTLTFPGACTVPAAPTNFVASRSGNVVSLSWAPPASGAVPSAYGVTVTGAISGEFTFPLLGVSAAVPSGTYNFSVFALSSCGRGASTAVQTVTVP